MRGMATWRAPARPGWHPLPVSQVSGDLRTMVPVFVAIFVWPVLRLIVELPLALLRLIGGRWK